MSALGGLFGSGGKEIKTTTMTESADMRTAVGGSVGSLVSPGAAVASPGGGAVIASPGSSVSQSISVEGMQSADVSALVGLIQTGASEQAAGVTRLGQGLVTGMQAQAQQVADILAATKAPETTMLTKLVPLLIALGVIWMLTR